MKEDYFSQLNDYDAPFCERQDMHWSWYIFFKFKSSDPFNPPELRQI